MERKIRDQKGITLVALVITIIVMLILVAVSVTVAINGELFIKAKEAGNSWEDKSAEEAVGNIINVDNKIMNMDNSINILQQRPAAEEPETTQITFTINKNNEYTTNPGTTWKKWIEEEFEQEYDETWYECTETQVFQIYYDPGTGGGTRAFLLCWTDEQGQYDETRPVLPTETIMDGASYACYTLRLD